MRDYENKIRDLQEENSKQIHNKSETEKINKLLEI